MSALFLACFVAGLVLAVYVMLHGVERDVTTGGGGRAIAPHEATGAHDPSTEPSVLFNAQNAAAFLCAFGAAGYLLTRLTGLGPVVVAGLALVVAAASVALSAGVLAGWVLPGARRETVDERYLLQGHPARVTVAIPAGAAGEPGEIEYESDGRRYVLRARSWDDSPIAAGADVAIERVEGGVAYVEQWAVIETRL
jgi:hypothetical protein